MVGLSVNDELEGNGKHFPNVYLEKLGRTMKTLMPADAPSEIRLEHVTSTSLQHCHYTKQLVCSAVGVIYKTV
jgi:hypothetical protein